MAIGDDECLLHWAKAKCPNDLFIEYFMTHISYTRAMQTQRFRSVVWEAQNVKLNLEKIYVIALFEQVRIGRSSGRSYEWPLMNK